MRSRRGAKSQKTFLSILVLDRCDFIFCLKVIWYDALCKKNVLRLSRDFSVKLQSSPDQAHFRFGLIFVNKQEIIKRHHENMPI